jgi:hypothetical protein
MKSWSEKTPEERLKDVMDDYESLKKEPKKFFDPMKISCSFEFKQMWDRLSSVGDNLDPWMHLKAPSEKTIYNAMSFIIDVHKLANEIGCWVYPLFINPTSDAEICLEFCDPKNQRKGKDISFYISETSITYLTAFNSNIGDMKEGEIFKTDQAVKLLEWMIC